MNIFTKRRIGPLPLLREESLEAQAARRRRELAQCEKLNKELGIELDRRNSELRNHIALKGKA